MIDSLPLVLDDLRALMGEPHRVYHGQAHVDALLDDFQAHRGAFHMPNAVELAIWFHDAVYEPGSRDNERRSAALLRARMASLVPAETLAAAEAMVLATERHAIPDGLAASLFDDLASFLDMDMAILGAAPAGYDRYADGVAREFVPVVGEVAYRKGRAAFLRDALDATRPVFLTARAWTSLEASARSNMRRELEGLC